MGAAAISCAGDVLGLAEHANRVARDLFENAKPKGRS